MNFSKKSIICNSNKFTEPIVQASENREHCSHRQYVMEVRNHIVSLYKSSHDEDGHDFPAVKLNQRWVVRKVSTDPTFPNSTRFGFHGITTKAYCLPLARGRSRGFTVSSSLIKLLPGQHKIMPAPQHHDNTTLYFCFLGLSAGGNLIKNVCSCTDFSPRSGYLQQWAMTRLTDSCE